MASHPNGNVPNAASDAVLKPSAPVPADAKEIHGIEFNNHKSTPITVEEMVRGMASMGFQASAVAEAVEIINEMVLPFRPFLASTST